jgi:hypothetical protein
VRERALAFRSRLVKAMGLGAADFQHLREELVKLRANLSDPVRAKPQPLPGDASRDTFAE